MNLFYDFHIHSALSPCADDDMRPSNILAVASMNGLNAIAVTDHNSIKNVQTSMEFGDAFGVTVIPGIEVQTNEDIHVLALFKSFNELQAFYNTINFPNLINNAQIFGNQLILDTDDNIVGIEEHFLLCSANEGLYDIVPRIIDMNGLAIPAHIDRESNGILAILGDIPKDLPFSAIEFSPYATNELKEKYSNYFKLISSDAHHIENISTATNFLNVQTADIEGIFNLIAYYSMQ